MSTLLLATKFNFPPPRPNLVPRPRLLERLDAGLYQANGFTRKLTLVSAPAGYGKTTLIAEWLNQWNKGLRIKEEVQPSTSTQGRPSSLTFHTSRVAWLSLDESDNDLARFLAYFIAALKGVDERLGETALSTFQSPQPPPSEIVLTNLINDIASVSTPFILALDDYHVINSPPIHRQLTFLLDHLPPQIHLVILTREDPLIPITRLRARGQVLEIRQDDLRFTVGETAEFLERVMGLSLSSDEIAKLERCTEGWIAGLQLAALSMQGRQDLSGFVQAFTGSSRFILDYLVDEVFERQSPDVKDFLLQTSILERLSGPLCDAVTGKTASQELLQVLEQSNLFIVPLDQSRLWYRYHHLFTELLRHRLRISHPAFEIELHQRASCWFEAEGLTGEAIQHALAAQDWRRAGALIQSISAYHLKRGEVLTIIGWFQSLPEELLLSDPRLCFEYCWPLLLVGHYDVATPLLERLEQSAINIPAFLGEIYAAQAYLARGVGNHERMIQRSQQALELLPKSSMTSRGIVALNLGLAYWHIGQMGDAEKVLTEALEIAHATGNLYAALTALIFLGRVIAVRGQLHQAAEYFNRAIQQGENIPINALAYIDLATLYYEWNKLDVSDIYLQKAVALCRQSQNDEFLVGCLLLCLRLRIAQGDTVGAEEALEQAWELVHAGNIPGPMEKRVDVAQAYLLIYKGEPIGEWGQKLTDNVDCHPFYRFLGVTKARILQGAHARAYLESLSQTAQANEWGYGLVAIRALQASLAETQADALNYLAEALHQAEGSEFIRAFVEVGEKLIPLLRETVRRGVFPDYAHRILVVMTGKGEIAGVDISPLIEPLSERELEVLRLVTAGMSNREIANELVISTGTAKSHIHHLCGKLGVRNRTEAAMKAKELGLV
jgi:LuxR family maltose regulon positive regulatory protein